MFKSVLLGCVCLQLGCVWSHLFVKSCMSLRVFSVCLHGIACISVCLRLLYLCLCVYVSACVYVFMCLGFRVCLRVFAWVSVCVCVCFPGFLYLCVSVVYVCVACLCG